MSNVITVSQLAGYLDARVKADERLRLVLIKGEVTAVRNSVAGHCFFTLTEGDAAIGCTMFAGIYNKAAHKPKEGEAAILQAGVQFYAKGGSSIRLLVTDYMPDGEGAKKAARAQLLEKLRAGGFLAEERKKPMPVLPLRIGLITAPNSAALADFLSITKQKNAKYEIFYLPTLMQGEKAPAAVAASMRRLDSLGLDVLVCIRGGGSKEDLSTFDEVEILRAAVCLKTPLLCGLGHEIDLSLLDLVADAHLPTPTAVAEFLAARQSDYLQKLAEAEEGITKAFLRDLTGKERELIRVAGLMPAFSVKQVAENTKRKLDLLDYRMNAVLEAKCKVGAQRIQQAQSLFASAAAKYLAGQESLLAKLQAGLSAMGPEETLRRGYAIPIFESPEGLKEGAKLRLVFAEQEAEALITHVKKRNP